MKYINKSIPENTYLCLVCVSVCKNFDIIPFIVILSWIHEEFPDGVNSRYISHTHSYTTSGGME